MMEIAALCLFCAALGLVIGFEWASKRSKKKEAPLPFIPDYDLNNPINGRRGETVEICGVTMWRM